MQATIINAIFQTQIITAFFLIALFFFPAKKLSLKFDNTVSEALKGFAMLGIVFSHIGYFLVTDHNFLFPLSIESGVGVNLFLLLSGLGLTLSQLNKPLSIKQFYLKRLPKILLPLWLVISCLFLTDWIFLHKTYSILEIAQSYLGFYPSSNIFGDLDSPLWYLSMILYFYLIFPIFFWPKKILLSALVMFVITYLILQLPLPIDHGVSDLYQLHFLAFPLGILTAWLIQNAQKFKTLTKLFEPLWLRVILAIILFGVFCYYSINSGVGQATQIEQSISLISTYLIMLVFWILPIRFKLFNLIGKYSYEIYLLHWPIIYRYDHLYKYLPASVATVLYIVEFIMLGFLLQKIVSKISLKNLSFKH